MIENKLRENIVQARKFNSYGSILVLTLFIGAVWLYEYSGLEVPMYVNTSILVLCLIVSPILVNKANKLSVAKCPKCQGIAEKGGFFGAELPERCPNCGLRVDK